MARYEARAQMFIARRMRDFYAGKMRDRNGRVVRNRPQALAIALSESRAKGLHVPRQQKGQRTMARKGQFKKGGGRVGGHSHKRKHHKSTALVRYVPSHPVVKYRTRTVVKTKRGGGRSLMRREMGAGNIVPGPFRLRSAAIAGLLGYADGGKGLTQVKDLLEKLPSIGKLPKEALAGLVLNYFADRGEWFDSGAQAFIDVGAYKLGQQGFSISGDDDY